MRPFKLFIPIAVSLCYFSEVQAQAVDIPITISDGTESGKKVLRFGLDPAATDGIDVALGESELPPVPPEGIFDARFIGTDIGVNIGQGLDKDYRQEMSTAQVTHVHELFYKVGTGGTAITISWMLPTDVTGLLEDLFGGLIVKQTMEGNGSVVVTNPGGISKLKMTVTYVPVAQLVAPSNLTATASGATQVELKWQDNSDNEEGFRIERKIEPGVYATLDTAAANNTTFSDSDIIEGTQYAYRIFAFSSQGESSATNEASTITPLAEPSDCIASAGCLNEIVITWRDNSNKELGYKIWRSPTGTEGTFTEIAATAASQTSYTDTGLESGITYHYRVIAFNDITHSNHCAVAATTRVLTWSSTIKLSDMCGGAQDLVFGQDPNATNGIDVDFCEDELPPSPPGGIFDARFELPTEPGVHSAIDIRNDTQAVADWSLIFQPGLCGYPLELEWDSSSLPDGRFFLKDVITGTLVNVDMKSVSNFTLTHTGIDRLKIEYTVAISKEVAVQKGWNIVSVPGIAPDMVVNQLFPTAISFAFGYDRGYVPMVALGIGRGYWLQFDAAQTVTIKGVAVASTTISVSAGWNLIGPFEREVPTNEITSTPSQIVSSGFFTFSEKYRRAAVLESGKGYWVKVKEAGELHLPRQAAQKSNVWSYWSDEIDETWGRLIVTDHAGRTVTLYSVAEEIDLSRYELPPIPPTGAFDARYSSNRYVGRIGIGDEEIRINSAEYPIRLRVEGIAIRVKDTINGSVLNEILQSGDEITVSDLQSNAMIIELAKTLKAPRSYQLHQNYPNPIEVSAFNPMTMIRYSLPVAGKVRLAVYNLLGEQVAELIDDDLEAGFHQVELNARNYPAGIYFYRLESGNFTDLKKLIVLK